MKLLICTRKDRLYIKITYTGENYTLFLEQKSILEKDERHKIHKQVEAEEIRKQIIGIILSTFEEEEPEELKWKCATLANCYFSLGDAEFLQTQ